MRHCINEAMYSGTRRCTSLRQCPEAYGACASCKVCQLGCKRDIVPGYVFGDGILRHALSVDVHLYRPCGVGHGGDDGAVNEPMHWVVVVRKNGKEIDRKTLTFEDGKEIATDDLKLYYK